MTFCTVLLVIEFNYVYQKLLAVPYSGGEPSKVDLDDVLLSRYYLPDINV